MNGEHASCRRFPERGPWILALIVCILACGCASEPEAPTHRSMVIPAGPPSGEVPLAEPVSRGEGPVDEAAVTALIDEAKRLAEAHDYDRALEVLREAQAADPYGRASSGLEVLKLTVKRHLLQSVYVDALVLLDSDKVALGNAITGELSLVNLSQKELFVPARRRFKVASDSASGLDSMSDPSLPSSRRRVTATGESLTTLYIEVEYTEFGLDGSYVNDRFSWSEQITDDFRLAPGERTRWPINLDTLSRNPGTINYRRYAISARLHPAALEIGEEAFNGALDFRPKVASVFPRGFEGLTDDPLARLNEALSKRSAVHVPLAAGLMPPADQGAALDALTAVLAAEGAERYPEDVRVASCVAAKILTGWQVKRNEALGPDDPHRSLPDLWLARLQNRER